MSLIPKCFSLNKCIGEGYRISLKQIASSVKRNLPVVNLIV
jgi:hypothetical protein